MDDDKYPIAWVNGVSGAWQFNGREVGEGDALAGAGKLEAGASDARMSLRLASGGVVGIRGASLSIHSGNEELSNVGVGIGEATGDPGSSASYFDLELGQLVVLIPPSDAPRKRTIGFSTRSMQFNLLGGESLALEVTDATTRLTVAKGSVTIFAAQDGWDSTDVRAGYSVAATSDSIEPQQTLSADARERLEDELRALGKLAEVSR